MTEPKERSGRSETIPEAKRTGRESSDPKSQPGEFADDLRANRSTPPDEGEGRRAKGEGKDDRTGER